MRTNKPKLTALLFLLITMGCGYRQPNILPTAENRAQGSQTAPLVEDTSQSQDQLPTALHSTPGACQADKWAIIPTNLFASPGAVGLKILYIPLAIKNNSSYWGQIDTTSGDPIRQSYVTTEGGFEYPAAQQVKIVTEFPYAALLNKDRLVSSQFYITNLSFIPPGFAIHGEAMIGFDIIEYEYGSPNTWAQAVYQVADNQNHYRITIPSLTVSCIHQDNQKYQETIGPMIIGVDENLHQPMFPTTRPDSEFISITKPITLPNNGLLEFQGIEYADGMADIRFLVMNFKYSNDSLDDENPIKISAFLLGNDGLSRRLTFAYGPPGCSTDSSLSLSQGQSANIKLCYQIGSQAANFKFLWIDEEHAIFQIYNLPEGF